VIKELERTNTPFIVIHTGQHYSEDLDKIFFEQLELEPPHYNLAVGSASHGVQTGKMLEGIEKILIEEKVTSVIVQGDTNSVLAGALAGAKLSIPVGHVEAGLRSYDRTMPEEINRVITDHISTYLFCPTVQAQDILIREGIDPTRISITGNTVVDSLVEHSKLTDRIDPELTELFEKRFALVTIHRPSNTDSEENLAGILTGLDAVAQQHELKILFPAHPRTSAAIRKAKLVVPDTITIMEPLGYIEFLAAMKSAQLIITDSGGVQEEACILKVPCITVRDNTERPETIQVGANVLSEPTVKGILRACESMLSRPREWDNPFGDGKSSERIVLAVLSANPG
jgi:UDP-N-acetylglucosamine 2-epimerase (non-hydrolysing)